jgi:hypothetical protein
LHFRRLDPRRAGKKVDRHGRPLTSKLTGEVEAWIENPAAGEDAEGSDEADFQSYRRRPGRPPGAFEQWGELPALVG